MLSASFLLPILLLLSYVCGRQIPVVNGVVGGVPATSRFHEVDAAVKPGKTRTTPGQLRIVENSGVCETTPGVYQASGYGDLTADESMWYVFLQIWFVHTPHIYCLTTTQVLVFRSA